MRRNSELLERIKRDARTYAGTHPGVWVIIKVQNDLRGWDTLATFCNFTGKAIPWV